MSKNGRSRSESVRAIERGGTYKHATDGRVRVTGIWKGKQWADTVSRTDEQSERTPIVVRYIPHDEGDWSDELAETLGEFLDATEAAG